MTLPPSLARVENVTRGTVVAERVRVARSTRDRTVGLLNRDGLAAEEGLWIERSPSIHMFFMRFAIDAVFVDGDMRVVGVTPNLRPWRAVGCRGSKAVLELAAGEAEQRGIEVGARLLVVEAPPVIDVDLTLLFDRVGAVLAGDGASGQARWDKIELLLTEGYAMTLALESERLRIERRLAERAASRRRQRSPQTRSLNARHAEVDRDIHCLRALLAELYHYGRDVRDGSSEPTERTSWRAA
jgi:uncharacterized protein